MRRHAAMVAGLLGVIWSQGVWGYPSAEKTTLDLGLNTVTAIRFDDERQLLYVISNGALTVVDLATFALAGASQTPFDISTNDDLKGGLKGIAVKAGTDQLFATQEGGNLLTYSLTSLTTKPTETVVVAAKDLTQVEYDSNADELLILNATDTTLLRYSLSSESVVATIALTSGTQTLTIDSMFFVPSISSSSGALYLTTGQGKVLVISSNSTTVGVITLDAAATDKLAGIAALPNSSVAYVVNTTDKLVHKVQTASGAVLGTISLAANAEVKQIVITDVTTPSAIYGFVIGSSGLSVFNTADDDVFDLGSTGTNDEPLTLSGSGPLVASDDGYLYLSFGKIGVITDHPFVTIPSVTYASGGSSMGSGEAVTLTFNADETGTYELRIGGDTTKNGTVLRDSGGATSGSIPTASTNQSVTLNYNDQSSVWTEGNNTVFVFVTDSDKNVGRRATTVKVDTPPPAVTIESVGFGTAKMYVNLTRLTQADISTYRVYADTDATLVTTKTAVGGTTAQPSSGSSVTVEVTGLTNGLTYFVAAEAVDSAGNVSPTRTTTLPGGSTAATGLPEETVGPAGLSGEAGCTLVRSRRQARGATVGL